MKAASASTLTRWPFKSPFVGVQMSLAVIPSSRLADLGNHLCSALLQAKMYFKGPPTVAPHLHSAVALIQARGKSLGTDPSFHSRLYPYLSFAHWSIAQTLSVALPWVCGVLFQPKLFVMFVLCSSRRPSIVGNHSGLLLKLNNVKTGLVSTRCENSPCATFPAGRVAMYPHAGQPSPHDAPVHQHANRADPSASPP